MMGQDKKTLSFFARWFFKGEILNFGSVQLVFFAAADPSLKLNLPRSIPGDYTSKTCVVYINIITHDGRNPLRLVVYPFIELHGLKNIHAGVQDFPPINSMTFIIPFSGSHHGKQSI